MIRYNLVFTSGIRAGFCKKKIGYLNISTSIIGEIFYLPVSLHETRVSQKQNDLSKRNKGDFTTT